MEKAHRDIAEQMRGLLAQGQAPPAVFRTALQSVPAAERDDWLDLVLGIDELPADGPDLPRGCAPYLPCSVDILLEMVDRADVQPADVFVDVGSGLGRAAALTHFLTGASAIGLEIQSRLVCASRKLMERVNASRVSVVEGDATRLAGSIPTGTVFFLYCPFSGERLNQVLCSLEVIARTRQIRICCVDLPLPALPWLAPISPAARNLMVYRSLPHHG